MARVGLLQTLRLTLSKLESGTELSLMELLVGDDARAEVGDSPPQQETKRLVVEYKPSSVERGSDKHSPFSSHKLTLVNKDSGIKAQGARVPLCKTSDGFVLGKFCDEDERGVGHCDGEGFIHSNGGVGGDVGADLDGFLDKNMDGLKLNISQPSRAYRGRMLEG